MSASARATSPPSTNRPPTSTPPASGSLTPPKPPRPRGSANRPPSGLGIRPRAPFLRQPSPAPPQVQASVAAYLTPGRKKGQSQPPRSALRPRIARSSRHRRRLPRNRSRLPLLCLPIHGILVTQRTFPSAPYLTKHAFSQPKAVSVAPSSKQHGLPAIEASYGGLLSYRLL